MVTQLDSTVLHSDEWRAQRAHRLGGSDMAAVLSLSKWDSPLSLWLRKHDAIADKPELPEMQWGTLLEPVIAQHWLTLHDGYHLAHDTATTWIHDTHTWMLANPDLLVTNPAGDLEALEVKTARYADEWGPDGGTGEDVPIYYLVQLLHYLEVLDAAVGHVAVLISGSDYRQYTVRRADHLAEVDVMLAEGSAFVASLESGTPPDIDTHSATYQAIRELHPDIDRDTFTDLTGALARDLLAAEAEVKRAEGQLSEQRARVLAVMGSTHRAVWDGQRVAYRTAKKRRDGTPGIPYLAIDRNAPDHTTITDTEGAAA